MLQPHELKLDLPMEVGNGTLSTTGKVWEILCASNEGDIDGVKRLVGECPDLIYAQYNYAPPVHFAVREGHVELVRYLLENGAHDPVYRIYPFLDSLQTVADDRGFGEIVALLDDYAESARTRTHYTGDNGRIHYDRTELQMEFQRSVEQSDVQNTERILKVHPELALDNTYFWGEGILLFAAKRNDRKLIDLLMSYGARVPDVLKWVQAYYFERFDGASYMMEKGMNPNTMSWQHVTILHNMAQKGFIDKAELLIKHGAEIDPIDEQYSSTPLGMAARWGQVEMVRYLLDAGADVNTAGAEWATPLTWARKKGHAEIADILQREGATES